MFTRTLLLLGLLGACSSNPPPEGPSGTGGSAGGGGMLAGGAGGEGGAGGGGGGGEGGSGGEGGQPACDFGMLACQGTCVKLDAMHCGSCDQVCGDRQICSAGRCVRMCSPSWGATPLDLAAPAAALALADLDGSGHTELIAAGDGLSVVGGSPVAVRQSVDTPGQVHAVAAGDVDGDGDVDAVIESGGKLWILTNDGGTLGAPVAAGDAGSEVSLALGDLDLDGKADLVALHIGGESEPSVLSYLHGTGTLFENPVTLTSADYVTNPVIGELDALPGTDLAFGTSEPGTALQIWHAVKTGPKLDSITTLDAPAVTLTSGDVDGDGVPDLVFSTADAARLGTVFRVLGALPGAGQVSPDLEAGRVQLADLDGEGIVDLVAGTNLLLGNGKGGFLPPLGLRIDADIDPGTFLFADLDGDGRTDLVGAPPTGGLRVYRGSPGHGYFGVSVAEDILDPPVNIGFAAAVDRAGQGKLDLAVLPSTGDRGSFFRNSGGGRLTRSDTIPASKTAAVASARIAGASYLAVASADRTFVLRYDSGMQTALTLPDLGGTPTAVALGDLDGDGQGDLVAGLGTTLQVFFGDGTSFGSPLPLDIPTGPVALAVADLDKDGHADLVVAVGSGICTILGSDGRTFADPVCHSPSGVRALTLGDLNDDGIPDMVVSLLVGVQSWIGKGDGTFVFDRKLYPQPATDVQLVDVDGDYNPELLATGANVGGFRSLLVHLDGGGVIESQQQVGPAVEPTRAFFADVDGDGVPDLVSVEKYGAVVTPGFCDAP